MRRSSGHPNRPHNGTGVVFVVWASGALVAAEEFVVIRGVEQTGARSLTSDVLAGSIRRSQLYRCQPFGKKAGWNILKQS